VFAEMLELFVLSTFSLSFTATEKSISYAAALGISKVIFSTDIVIKVQ